MFDVGGWKFAPSLCHLALTARCWRVHQGDLHMPAVTEAAVRKVLDDFRDPETGRSVTQLEQVHDVRLDDGKLAVTLGLTTHSALLWQEIGAELEDLLAAKFSELKEVKVAV